MRIKSGVYTRSRKKKVFKIAKGYYSNRRNRWRQTIQQVERSLRFAYKDRKDRKASFRRLWTQRINAASRENGVSYSRLISGLKKAGVPMNRKILADLAVYDSSAFKELVSIAQSQ